MYKNLLFLLLLVGLFPHSLIAQVDADKDFLSTEKVDFSIGSALMNNGMGSYNSVNLNKPGYKNSLFSGSLDNENFGGGLKLHYSQSFKTDVVDCSQNIVEPVAPQVTALAPLAISIACGQVKEDDSELYSSENCKLLDSCAQMKLKREDSTYAGYFLTPKLVAEDYAGLLLDDNIFNMERLESLRKFAEKKFGKIHGASCKPQFDYSEKNLDVRICDKGIVESGFTNFHETCAPMTRLCVDLGKDYGKNVSENDSALQNFYTQKIDSRVTNSLTSDNEVLESLSTILVSKTKPEEKLRAIFSKLKELNNNGKLDPVLGYAEEGISGDDIKTSPHFDFFRKLISRHLTTASAKSAIEKHRRDYTKEVFNKSCKSSLSYMDICKKATSVAGGNGALYPSRLVAATRLKRVDSKHTDILKLLYPKGVLNDKDALIILNAQRCIALGVNKSHTFADYIEGSFGSSASISDAYNSRLGTGLSIGGIGFNNTGSWALAPDAGFRYTSPDKTDAKKATNDSVKIDFDDTSKLSGQAGGAVNPESKSGSDTVVESNTDKTLSDSFSDNFKSASSIDTAPITNNQNYAHANNTFTNYSNVTDQPASTDEKTETKKSAGTPSASPGSGLNDRISELTKKLSATEEHLAKLKEERDAADEQNAIQKKKDDDNQQIADLKKQINDLKTAPAKTIEAEKKSEVAEDYAPVRPVISSRAPASEKLNEADNASQGHVSTEAQSASRSASAVSNTSGDSAVPVRSGAIVSAGGSSSSKGTITLTKVDGMSAEKFSESINDKIIELGGQSFEIEENGIKIEIVPEVKDGKILLDAKGKPRFIKKIKSATEVKTRVPASVTDKADLQRKEEEALKHERAEYLKLKNITNKAIQKN